MYAAVIASTLEEMNSRKPFSAGSACPRCGQAIDEGRGRAPHACAQHSLQAFAASKRPRGSDVTVRVTETPEVFTGPAAPALPAPAAPGGAPAAPEPVTEAAEEASGAEEAAKEAAAEKSSWRALLSSHETRRTVSSAEGPNRAKMRAGLAAIRSDYTRGVCRVPINCTAGDLSKHFDS